MAALNSTKYHISIREKIVKISLNHSLNSPFQDATINRKMHSGNLLKEKLVFLKDDLELKYYS